AGPCGVAGGEDRPRRVRVPESAGGLDVEGGNGLVDGVLGVVDRSRGRVVEDDRDSRHYAAARGVCAVAPRRSSSARAFASASGLGALPRAEASSARASSARSAYSACVGVLCARSSTRLRMVVPCSAASRASRSRAAVLTLMLVSSAAIPRLYRVPLL